MFDNHTEMSSELEKVETRLQNVLDLVEGNGGDCIGFCTSCDDAFWSSDGELKDCDTCNEPVCKDCASYCENCKVTFCDADNEDHQSYCACCDLVCNKLLSQCQTCNSMLCNEHLNGDHQCSDESE